ncbi:MAG: hypothetical protein OK455_06590 [Thaumarchaeota archaeon]|nr:hypothetical protein [Nitrososphaerota archaeon]
MSFLLDPLALLFVGFVAGKAYYLLAVFSDRVFRRRALKKELVLAGVVVVALFWTYSASLYLNVIYFPWPLARWYGGTAWMLNSGLPLGLTRSSGSDILAIFLFAAYPFWFYAGTRIGLSGHRYTRGQRLLERNRIVTQLAATTFPKGGAIPPGASELDSAASVEDLFTKILPLFDDALMVLLFVFDSRFLVFAFTGKFKRFVDLDSDDATTLEKQKYLEAWYSNASLVSAAQILRIAASFGYYTKPQVYKLLDYIGPMTPNLPPWFSPGRTAVDLSSPPQVANEVSDEL